MPDKITILNKRLREVKKKFEDLQKSGIDEEILIAWICNKTRMKRADVMKILKSQEEFYDKLIKESILETLKEK